MTNQEPSLPTRRQWRALDRRLVGAHGSKLGHGRRGDPLDALIGTILSQSTNDVLSSRAYDSLKERFQTWEDALHAPIREIAAAIEMGGLSKAKARWIKAILEELTAERGELSLDFLKANSPAETMKYLTHFEGVGPKTAACVLLFALDQPVFPVDTHIHRIARRMGWIADKDTAERTHQVLDAAIPDELKHQLHVNLIAHGRTVCNARGPRCGECVVRSYCAFGRGAKT
jgi:endonuclease-3